MSDGWCEFVIWLCQVSLSWGSIEPCMTIFIHFPFSLYIFFGRMTSSIWSHSREENCYLARYNLSIHEHWSILLKTSSLSSIHGPAFGYFFVPKLFNFDFEVLEVFFVVRKAFCCITLDFVWIGHFLKNNLNSLSLSVVSDEIIELLKYHYFHYLIKLIIIIILLCILQPVSAPKSAE